MARYSDLTGHDTDISSDAGYSLLSDNDLGIGLTDGTLKPDLLVGRLPIARDSSLGVLETYFANASNSHLWPVAANRKTLAVSCLKWEEASSEVAAQLGKREIFTSPHFSDGDLANEVNRMQPECLYFNVHGSDSDPRWVGEGNDPFSGHPVAATPENFRLLSKPNIIATEACYGGRFAELDLADSAVMSALATNTIAFFGSTRIAYGPHQPPNWGADTVVREFLLPFCSNPQWAQMDTTAGEILAKSKYRLRGDLCTRSAEVAMLRKTFLSFHLFGDPTLFYSTRSRKSRDGGAEAKVASDISQRIDQLHSQRGMDLSVQINTGLGRLQENIRSRVNQQVASVFPQLANIQPTERSYREPSGREAFLLTYLAETIDGFRQGVIVSCSDDGQMGRIYCFK